ncbi:flagellar hook-length control protein FliK [Devosia sp. 2618]|uniref:flagellar hook-length control protein FliK n=1 Tax=Devosia sp. 2618 TaxID=3156454 RepID=UPI0033928F39
MATPLSFLMNTGGTSSNWSSNAANNANKGRDAFAELLGSSGQKTETKSTSSSTARVDLFGSDTKDRERRRDTDPIAAPVDATIPARDRNETGRKVAKIVDQLADVRSKLEAGEKLDPEQLKKLNADLTDLADELGIDLSAFPSLTILAGMVGGVLPDDASLQGQMMLALGPLAQSLLDGSAGTGADADVATLMDSIGKKLGALLQSINQGDVPVDQLAELGSDASADLDAALARLMKPAVKIDAAAPPVLGTPELKLPESALTTKTAEQPTAAPADKSAQKTETPDAVRQIGATAAPTSDKPAPAEVKVTAETHKPVETKAVAAPVVADDKIDAQPTIPTAQTARVDAVAAPRVVQVGYQTSQQQLNLPQLAFEIARQVTDGNTRFQIRLDPADLGKIDVRLDIDTSGHVKARLVVEKSETLDLMQRDQRGLEKALQQAGLDSNKTSLEFSLKQGPFSGQQGQGDDGRQALFGNGPFDETDETPPPQVNLYRGSLSASGVNIIA